MSRKATIHNLTNLKSYYNRQLPNFTSIIEESIGIEQEPMRLFTTVLPIF